ncbi:hypothetical protein ACFOEK_04625 [Litoribrevibacter euphylliae]|uniref:Oligosaccharide repeat unit polymerase n=1 Tax=Litoribrevibacter euphylliae TaxID=1834034 RepID=A0ABV7H910_9GAMM
MKITLAAVLVILLSSMETTPLLSILTLGGGNTLQFVYVFFLLVFFLLIKSSVRIPDRLIFIIFLFGVIELLGQIAMGVPFSASPMIILTVLSITYFKSVGFGYEEYGRILYKYTDILVIINFLCLSLAVIDFDTFSHAPTALHDEAIYRKLDVDGEVRFKSIGFSNFLPGSEVAFNLIGVEFMPTGLSAEPHVFFSLILVGFSFRLYFQGFSSGISILFSFLYLFSLSSTVSFSNLVAIMLSLFFIFMIKLRPLVLKKFVFYCAVVLSLGALYSLSSTMSQFSDLSSFQSGGIGISENLSNRSGYQSILAFFRIFTPSLEFGFITYGPSLANSYQVDSVFFVNFILYWLILFFLLVLPSYRLITYRGAVNHFLVFPVYYLFVYSLKNVSLVLFYPYIFSLVILFYYYTFRFTPHGQ